jgi:hypothetical protein
VRDDPEQMRATEDDLRRARFIANFSKYFLLPAALLLAALRISGIIRWPWWVVLTPGVLYLLHPIVIGALGPFLQYRRYRRRSGDNG